MATIKDVAKKSKVSTSTASRALHNNGYVSPKVKQRVKKAAKELGYVVNYNALLLKDKSTKNVGVVISDIQNPYFINVVHDSQRQLAEHGYGLILALSNNNIEDEEKQIKYLIGNKVSTILFIPTSNKNDDTLKLAKSNGINIIQLFINVYEQYNSIVNDDENGVYLAGKKLIEDGYKRIALIDVKYDDAIFTKDVEPRRSNALERLNNEYPKIKTKAFYNFATEEFDKKLITGLDDFAPDAIIAGTGMFGLNILNYLKVNSLNTKVVSFDDNSWFAFHGITTIRQNEQELIDEIVRLVLKNDTENVEHIKIDEHLVLRK